MKDTTLCPNCHESYSIYKTKCPHCKAQSPVFMPDEQVAALKLGEEFRIGICPTCESPMRHERLRGYVCPSCERRK